VIVTPAAYTAVDKAESETALAGAVNAVAPGVFGEEADALGALVVHYSTDYVFDGALDRPYVESDATDPQGVYGQTKRDGELALAKATARHVILRTSWVVGAHGGNFAKTLLRLSAERDSLNVVADQWGHRPRRRCWRMSRRIWCGSGMGKAMHSLMAFIISPLAGRRIGVSMRALWLRRPCAQVNR
jgi:dTDP-4-dehydrorhamnose reductase